MTVLFYYLTFHVCASIWLSIKMLASLIHASETLLHPAALTKKPILVKQSGEMLYIMLLSRRHTIHISILKDSLSCAEGTLHNRFLNCICQFVFPPCNNIDAFQNLVLLGGDFEKHGTG